MGLFSFVGKVLKGVSKVAGFIPGVGGTISKVTGIAGNLLDHKSPMSGSISKVSQALRLGGGYQAPVVMRGNSTQAGSGSLLTAQGMRSSPVLPGGAVATASGPVSKSAAPPRTYGGKRASTKRRKTTKRRSSTAKRRTTKKRKLKFGSAAYRKKYLKHR